jgi:structural maintenance of chromosome 2
VLRCLSSCAGAERGVQEGLFTNANVLFRARFRDGTSVVERTASRSTNPATAAMYEDERAAATARKVSRSRPPLTEVNA